MAAAAETLGGGAGGRGGTAGTGTAPLLPSRRTKGCATRASGLARRSSSSVGRSSQSHGLCRLSARDGDTLAAAPPSRPTGGVMERHAAGLPSRRVGDDAGTGDRTSTCLVSAAPTTPDGIHGGDGALAGSCEVSSLSSSGGRWREGSGRTAGRGPRMAATAASEMEEEVAARALLLAPRALDPAGKNAPSDAKEELSPRAAASSPIADSSTEAGLRLRIDVPPARSGGDRISLA